MHMNEILIVLNNLLILYSGAPIKMLSGEPTLAVERATAATTSIDVFSLVVLSAPDIDLLEITSKIIF